MSPQSKASNDNFSQAELDKFGALAQRWWDPEGPQKALHALNPARLGYIADRVKLQGATVLDVGCGSAPIADHLAGRNVRFTGVDWSSAQIARNAASKPDAEFVAGSLYDIDFGGRQFDVVTNLYVIEHAVWPHRLLDSLYRLAKPGGLIAILTPPFRHGTYLKSFDYGLSAIPFKDKVRRLKWIDAALHAYQHRVVVPGVLRREYPRGTPRGRFLINLDPVGLRPGVAFFPDADAVYLSDTEEMLAWLVDLGAAPVAHWPEWGYVLAKKPA